MASLKEIISLIIGLIVGGLIWVFFGELLSSFTSNILVFGGFNGVIAISGGVFANVFAGKLLGISDEADV